MYENGNGSKRRWWTMPWARPRKTEEDLAAYRRLALQLHYDLPQGQASRSVLVVTPDVSPLSARSSLNLALCLTELLGRRVLLVDACPTTPELSRHLGGDPAVGFAEYITNADRPLEPLVLPASIPNLSFLPAGEQGGGPASPERISQLLAGAAQQHDFLLLAGGSVLNNPFALALAPFVGCVLLAVTEHQTTLDDLDDAQTTLEHCKARSVRLLLATPVGRGFALPQGDH